MIKIAVVDDEEICVNNIRNILNAYVGVELYVNFYSDGQKLLLDGANNYDLVLVDIEMPTIGGIELARRLVMDNSNILIFYITSHVSLVTKAINNYAFTFVPKPIVPSDLYMELDRAIDYMSNRNKVLTLDSCGMTHYVLIRELVYVEVQGKKCYLHLINGSIIVVEQRLHNLVSMLDGSCVIQCHKSYVINMKHLVSISNSYVSLAGGFAIPLGRRYLDFVKRNVNIFMGRQYDY